MNEREQALVEKLAEALAQANEQVDKEQIKRPLASYVEGIKTGVAIKIALPALTDGGLKVQR